MISTCQHGHLNKWPRLKDGCNGIFPSDSFLCPRLQCSMNIYHGLTSTFSKFDAAEQKYVSGKRAKKFQQIALN